MEVLKGRVHSRGHLLKARLLCESPVDTIPLMGVLVMRDVPLTGDFEIPKDTIVCGCMYACIHVYVCVCEDTIPLMGVLVMRDVPLTGDFEIPKDTIVCGCMYACMHVYACVCACVCVCVCVCMRACV